ncbi:unnamed protein product [Phytophthora fragariaefolia]|uniref:Unnamed protein product n=1 Tax=Phytophthora fragariaefolia TaxID=1490495 RepID=A0A9W6XYC4_9STRA|nr:unnamed protein product [Phytophthora fragariaefolia]
MQAPELPLPDQLQVRITIKSGYSLTACRDKLAPIDSLFQVTTGYGGLRGAVVEIFGRHLPNVWRHEFDLYLKPSNNAPQRDFSVIQEGEHEFNVQLKTVWYTARLHKNSQADFRLMIFVNVPCPQRTITFRRATAARVDEQAPRITSFVREDAIDASPTTQHYMSVCQTRLPDKAQIQTPDATTFRLQTIRRLDTCSRLTNTKWLCKLHKRKQIVLVIVSIMPSGSYSRGPHSS